MAAAEEIALTFRCGEATLVGILHRPARPRPRGVVVVVGAPQYRVGSHRQFVLLARALAAEGYPVLRFDYRGMGDSDGPFSGFEGVDDDIRAAVDTLFARVPEVREAVLWGLCDGASAIAFYAAGDDRIAGIVLLNPWVRTEGGLAQAHMAQYGRKLVSAAFWRRLREGEVDPVAALRGLGAAAAKAVAARRERRGTTGPEDPGAEPASLPLPDRVAHALRRFRGRVLLILSGNDLTAQEFEATVLRARAMARWAARPNVTVRRLAEADHTFSTRPRRRRMHEWTLAWLSSDEMRASAP